jgi:IclR family acetate operon transcriptional repressor
MAVKALAAGLRVLAEFSGDRSLWSVTDLAARTGYGISRMSKILSTLRESGFLDQDPATREYTVAIRAFALGARFIDANPLVRQALPVMRELLEAKQHTVTLSIMVGREVIYLAAVEGPLFLDGGWRAGIWLPYHGTAAGKVLTAFLPEQSAAALIEDKGLPRFTDRTIISRPAFEQQLRAIRSAGFATTRAESTPGLGAIAVPVFGRGEGAIAALGLLFPSHVVTEAQQKAFAAPLHRAARRISAKMGAYAYPFGGFESRAPASGAEKLRARSGSLRQMAGR